jgi:hypothetical protein
LQFLHQLRSNFFNRWESVIHGPIVSEEDWWFSQQTHFSMSEELRCEK